MMTWKKSILLAVLLLIVLAVTRQLIHWSNAKRNDPSATFLLPRLRLAVITVKHFSSETTDMDVRMLIDDPAPIGFTVDSFSYRFSIAGVEVIKASRAGTFSLRAYDSTSITLPVTVKQELLLKPLKDLQVRKVDSVDYTIDAEFHTRLPFLKKKLMHLHVTRHLPLFIIPDVQLAHTRIEKFGLKNTRLMLDLRVSNPNNIPFAFRKTVYELRVGGDHLLRSRIDSVFRIPARDTVMIAMPMQLDLGEAAETLFQLLIEPGTHYAFTFDTHIVSDNNSINESRLELKRQGTLRDLKH